MVTEQPAFSFAGLLRQLRAEARLTQEELAALAGVSARSVSNLERGINRTAHKDTAVLLAGALGLTGPAAELFVAAARSHVPAAQVLAAAAGAGPRLGPVAGSPYRGLAMFGEQDAGWYFGREAAAVALLDRMSRLLAGTGLLVVSGASGAGKSSLLRAGMLPRIRREGLAAAPEAAAWPCVVFTPTRAPLDELALRVAPLAGADAAAVRRGLAFDPDGFALTARQAARAQPPDPTADPDGLVAGRDQPPQRRLLLVVDQFEQLFTQCADASQRRGFITALHAAATAGHGPDPSPAALVVLGVRADFEARCADYPQLAGPVQDRYLVTAMTGRQLRMAITEPARKAGSTVDDDLTGLLPAEVRTGRPATSGAGVLPLLSHALDQAWRSRAGQPVTLADYERTGGIEGAVAASAQRAYDGLTPARQVFERLSVTSPEGADYADRATTGIAAAGVQGFPVVLTSFVGRAGAVREVAGLLEEYRLVTVTGPGGVGKTRLAGEVARRVAGRFADGVWLAGLAAIRDPAQVPSAVVVALGAREQAGVPSADALARVLGRRQLLLVLDNCEHVIGAAAELCGQLLQACDDMRILVTSREPLAVAGEARHRLGPLTVPGPDVVGDDSGAEAVTLFADRARAADAGFALTDQNRDDVARLVGRLDGMPLAIELAAARVEALGVSQMLDRLDGRLGLLAGGDRLAAGRHRSLAATAEWSYQLLGEDERRVFRLLSVFPAPFTVAPAEAVAGQEAAPVVLRLVDCSLLMPPRPGPDGRSRYAMLETLRCYGAGLLAQAGEQDQAQAALARYALQVAEEAGAGLRTTTGEPAAARRLDAEDAMMGPVLAWAVEHDLDTAARLVTALVPWWVLRGRLAGQAPLLGELADWAGPGSDGWCTAQLRLGWIAFDATDVPQALQRCATVLDVLGDRAPSRALADCLAMQSTILSNLGRVQEAAGCGRRALAMARELGYPSGQVFATTGLVVGALYNGDLDEAVELARQSAQIPDIPGTAYRLRGYLLAAALAEAGDLAAAEQACADTLARARDAGDVNILGDLLRIMADLDLRAGRAGDAAVHLREAAQLSLQGGSGS